MRDEKRSYRIIAIDAIGITIFTIGIVAWYDGVFSNTLVSWIGYAALVILLPISYMMFFLWYEHRADDLKYPVTLADFRLGYKLLNSSIVRRENSLLVSGSIFVTASTFLIGQAGLILPGFVKEIIVWSSWTIYAIWLMLFQLTTYGITEVTYKRLRDIEEQMGIEIHRYLKNWRNPWRKWIWLWLFDGLLLVGFVLLGYSTMVFL